MSSVKQSMNSADRLREIDDAIAALLRERACWIDNEDHRPPNRLEVQAMIRAEIKKAKKPKDGYAIDFAGFFDNKVAVHTLERLVRHEIAEAGKRKVIADNLDYAEIVERLTPFLQHALRGVVEDYMEGKRGEA